MLDLHAIGLALGVSYAAGLNAYATVATLGLLHRFGVVALAPGLEPVAHPIVLSIAILLYVVEFFADKIPIIDNLWDAVHTFIRPPAAAVLAYAAVTGVEEPWRISAALVAGGVALTAHGVKATSRTAVNTSPEPVSNTVVSTIEDALAIGLTWLAAAYPLVALAAGLALIVVSVYVFVRVARFLGRLARSPGHPGRAPARAEKET